VASTASSPYIVTTVQSVRWPSKNHLGCTRGTGRPFSWAKKVAFLCVICKRKEGVVVRMAVYPRGAPERPGPRVLGPGRCRCRHLYESMRRN
jgi:hypothetical protein